MTGKKKKKKHDLKWWILKIHLWLGLASGLVVFLLSVTGCLYVFHHEFTSVFRQEVNYVPIQGKPLSLENVWENTQQQLGGHQIAWATVPNESNKSWVFSTYKNNPDGFTWFETIDYYESVYVDPYTGEILGVYDEEHDFFTVVKMLHWNLLIPTEIGQPIVGWSTFIFVILLITGLVLWWPKNKKSSRQKAFGFKWKPTTGWKRKNYDLHNVLGFYSLSIALILGLTGMVWSFTWFHDLVYVVGAGTLDPPKIEQGSSTFAQYERTVSPLDSVFVEMKEIYPNVNRFRIVPPTDSTGTIDVYAQEHEAAYYESHRLQFDQYSGKLLAKRNHSEKNFGEKLIQANYDVHVGAILGLPGKILAFFASLICASLPLTGLLVWLNKKKKKKKATKIK